MRWLVLVVLLVGCAPAHASEMRFYNNTVAYGSVLVPSTDGALVLLCYINNDSYVEAQMSREKMQHLLDLWGIKALILMPEREPGARWEWRIER